VCDDGGGNGSNIIFFVVDGLGFVMYFLDSHRKEIFRADITILLMCF